MHTSSQTTKNNGLYLPEEIKQIFDNTIFMYMSLCKKM